MLNINTNFFSQITENTYQHIFSVRPISDTHVHTDRSIRHRCFDISHYHIWLRHHWQHIRQDLIREKTRYTLFEC